MFKANDYVVYKRKVCLISSIKEKYIHNTNYYILTPLSDNSLTINVPTNTQDIRSVISKAEVNRLINKIPSINIIEGDNKTLENIYKALINEDKYENLIQIIKTTFLRNKERLDNNKKTTDKDNYYFDLAENYLYNEFSIALGLSFEETKEYVIKKVQQLLKK